MSKRTDEASINVEMWEPGDWVITINGRPVGQTFSTKREAREVADWLQTTGLVFHFPSTRRED